MSINVKFDQIFNKTVAPKQIHECVCYVESGTGVFSWSKCYGEKSLETPLLVASVTKLFTTTCIIKLLESSKLKLTDKVEQCFEPGMLKGIHNFKGTDYSSELSIANLLFQTSGLPDWFLDGSVSYARKMVQEDFSFNFEQVLQATKELKPKFPPGTPKKAYYSDINFDLLGKIIEHVTAMTLREVYEDFIINPLNLKNSY